MVPGVHMVTKPICKTVGGGTERERFQYHSSLLVSASANSRTYKQMQSMPGMTTTQCVFQIAQFLPCEYYGQSLLNSGAETDKLKDTTPV